MWELLNITPSKTPIELIASRYQERGRDSGDRGANRCKGATNYHRQASLNENGRAPRALLWEHQGLYFSQADK